MKEYPKYKSTDNSLFKVIPADWSLIRLKHVSDISYGLGQPPKEKKGGLPFIRATNVERGIINTKNLVYVDPNDVPYDRNPILNEEDIVVVRSGVYTGDSAIIDKSFGGSVAGYDMIVRVKQGIPKFISYLLLSHEVLKHQLHVARMRAAQPHLNAEELGETVFPFPPESLQIRIADYLISKTSQIDDLIAKKRRLIELLHEQRTALINRAVTKGLNPDAPMKDSGIEWLGAVPAHWIVKRMRHICSVRQGLQIARTERKFEPELGAFQYITIKAINNPDAPKEYILNPRKNVVCQKDDILIARTGATGEVITNQSGVFHNNFFLVDYDRASIHKNFLLFYLTNSSVKKYLLLCAGDNYHT